MDPGITIEPTGVGIRTEKLTECKRIRTTAIDMDVATLQPETLARMH